MTIQVSEALVESARQGLAGAIFKAFQCFERPGWGKVNSIVADMCRAVTAAKQLGATQATPLTKDEGKQLAQIIGPLIDLNLQEEVENLVFKTFFDRGMDPDIADRVRALKAKELAEREARFRGATTQSDKGGDKTVN